MWPHSRKASLVSRSAACKILLYLHAALPACALLSNAFGSQIFMVMLLLLLLAAMSLQVAPPLHFVVVDEPAHASEILCGVLIW